MKTTASILLLVFLSGCTIIRSETVEKDHYYLRPSDGSANVARVVVFEFDNQTNRADLSHILTNSITEAVRKKHLFTVTSLYRSDPTWQNLALGEEDGFDIRELAAIRSQLKADAVLFGCINQYYPYPHMFTGLHLKMVDLRTGELLWALEQVWDSTDKAVENRMRKFFDNQMRSGYQPMDWQLLVTSPRAFNKFVAWEVAGTFDGWLLNGEMRLSSEKNLNFRQNSTILDKTLQIPEKTLKFADKFTTMRL